MYWLGLFKGIWSMEMGMWDMDKDMDIAFLNRNLKEAKKEKEKWNGKRTNTVVLSIENFLPQYRSHISYNILAYTAVYMQISSSLDAQNPQDRVQKSAVDKNFHRNLFFLPFLLSSFLSILCTLSINLHLHPHRGVGRQSQNIPSPEDDDIPFEKMGKERQRKPGWGVH